MVTLRFERLRRKTYTNLCASHTFDKKLEEQKTHTHATLAPKVLQRRFFPDFVESTLGTPRESGIGEGHLEMESGPVLKSTAER